MKFGKDESILKLDKCWALFQIHLLVTQDPCMATNINQEKCLGEAGFWICTSFISQLRGAPSREDASSLDRGSPHCSGSGE